MPVKINTLEVEDIGGDIALVELAERPNGQGIIKLGSTGNLWLDKRSAQLIGSALLLMAERID